MFMCIQYTEHISSLIWLTELQNSTLTSYCGRYTLLVSGWASFAVRTALIFHSVELTRYCKNSSKILVQIYMITAADLSATHTWCESPGPPHPHDLSSWVKPSEDGTLWAYRDGEKNWLEDNQLKVSVLFFWYAALFGFSQQWVKIPLVLL